MDRENRKFLKKLSACVAVLFVIVTVVSLCVMNFTPINRLLGGYKEQPLDLSRADGANITYNDDGTITLGEGYSEIEFTGIDARRFYRVRCRLRRVGKQRQGLCRFRRFNELILPHKYRKAHARKRARQCHDLQLLR